MRSVPLTFLDNKAQLRKARERLRIFFRHFQRVVTSGDAIEQLESSARSVRENRMAKAVQTAVHWLAEAARTLEDEYRLLPVWTALDAVLCAIEYPPIFDKRHVDIKKALRTAIDEICDDGDKTDKAGVVSSHLQNSSVNTNYSKEQRPNLAQRRPPSLSSTQV